ncbi:MAG: hypothetical protein IJ515_03415 [Clostridia bacterium]|nr:hypothetical protein [Clostridia bacterium]
MKKKYLFCTNAWFYLSELPLAFLLVVACRFNSTVDTLMGLIPLIVVLSAAMIFIFLYFFRMVVISYEEIKMLGLFSSRDKAIINKDKTLILTIRPGADLKIELFGNNGTPSLLSGLKDDPPMDIYLFRGKVIGRKRAAKSILRFFKMSEEDIVAAVGDFVMDKSDTPNVFFRDCELFTVTSEKIDDNREIRIKFKETI